MLKCSFLSHRVFVLRCSRLSGTDACLCTRKAVSFEGMGKLDSETANAHEVTMFWCFVLFCAVGWGPWASGICGDGGHWRFLPMLHMRQCNGIQASCGDLTCIHHPPHHPPHHPSHPPFNLTSSSHRLTVINIPCCQVFLIFF